MKQQIKKSKIFDYKDINTTNQTITYNGKTYQPGSVFISNPTQTITKNNNNSIERFPIINKYGEKSL